MTKEPLDNLYDYRMKVIYHQRNQEGDIIKSYQAEYDFKFPYASLNDMEMRLECTDKRIANIIKNNFIKWLKS